MLSYGVVGSSKKEATTSIEKDNRNHIPNPSNDVDDDGEKLYPLIVESDKRVTYNARVSADFSSQETKMNNITILSRLPFANNTQLFENNNNVYEPLIDSTFKITNANFWNKKGANVNGITSDDVIPQLSLTDLQIEGVYLLKNTQDISNATAIDSSKYKIYYTTNPDATFDTPILADGETFDSTKFVEYIPGGTNTDFAQAKNLKVVFNEDYTLNSGYSAIVKYSMKMPNQSGMVGASTAIKYTANNVVDYLYSPEAYVINGNENVNIEVQKKFENLPVGTAPAELENGLANIQFKLYYLDETTGEVVYLKDNQNNDVIATTDANGVAKFLNIPAREYVLEEITTFDNYRSVDGVLLAVEPGDTLHASENIVENPIKRATLVITKLWNNHEDGNKRISLRVSRKDNPVEIISYSTTKYTKNGTITLNQVPYGEYTITESTGLDGWTAEVPVKTIQVYAPTVNETFNNVPSTATMKIVKTVPSRETVDGLKFKVTGRGKVTFLDENNVEQNTNSETVFEIGNETTYGSNITVEKSNNNRTATITISNLYLGLYTIEEIGMPTVGDPAVPMYQPVKQNATLSEQGSEVTVDILNNYKYGTLAINKTAKLKEKNNQTNEYEYTNIADLSSFLVRVTGRSYYGTTVDETIALDINGHGEIELEIGKYTVTEVENVPYKGFTAYYGADKNPVPPTDVTVKYDETVTQDIYNEFTGVGYVRVEKSLEGVTNPQEVVDAGIQFVVAGKNIAGGDVREVINIDKIDGNVAYGISGPISAYGEYGIEEVGSTVPRGYEAESPREIQITVDNTQENPLVINAVNTRGIGQLEITTKTDPEGGPLTGIIYKVTEVKINKNGTYTKVGDSTTVFGSNDEINPSFAKLDYVKAGYYLVEQTAVPDGWIKDLSQIVEVPINNTGYASFEITQKQALKTNKVYVNKIILNENGNVASQEDFEAAKLNENESFEVKITNVTTGAEYYVFTSPDKQGVIQGLDEGTYRLEEVYKPKYTTEGYYKNVEVPSEVEGALPTIGLERISETQGQGYLFTITEDENVIKDVTLTIKNQINTDFGFGGQNHIDNLGKIEVEEGAITYSSRAIIYVVDENNNAVSGVKFSLYNSNGQKVTLNKLGSEFEISDKKLIIRGLPVGKYTLKCVEYPNEYLKPDDMIIYVYSDAALAQKIEVKKNIPRGSIKLGTKTVNPDGSTEFVARSQYKVVDKATGQLVKFTKTYSGNYEKSNLDEASPLVSLKAGTVDLTGLEVGTYEIGLVDVTDGYGIIKDKPETVEVVKNTTQNIIVNVAAKGIKDVKAGSNSVAFLDESGHLFVNGYQSDNYPVFADGTTNSRSTLGFEKIKFPVDDVTIVKCNYNDYLVTALDSEGRIWMWGCDDYMDYRNSIFGRNTQSTPYRIIPDSNNTFAEDTKFVDIETSERAQTALALDENGVLYIAGYGTPGNSDFVSGLKKVEYFDNEENKIIIKKIAGFEYSSSAGNTYTVGVIDSAGRLWTWGTNINVNGTGETSTTPVCISDSANMNNIVDAIITEKFGMALDNDGNVWIWGTGDAVENDMVSENYALPHKIDSATYFGGKKIKQIAGRQNMAAVIDEDGNVWTWGNGYLGQDGNNTSTSTSPVCITAENGVLEGKTIKNIDMSIKTYSGYVAAVDTNDVINIWGYNQSSNINVNYEDGEVLGKIDWDYQRNFEYNLKFKDVYTASYSYFAIDDLGRIWSWGSNSNYQLGLGNNSTTTSTPQLVPGTSKFKKISYYNDVTLALTEDGRIYYCGGSATKTFKDITKKFNLPQDSMITDIYVNKPYSGSGAPGAYALDSKGKVYLITNTSSSSYDTIANINVACISHDSDGDIFRDNAKIIKLTGYTYGNYIFGLSDDGKIYGIQYYHGGSGKKQILMSAGETMVDIAHNYALDSDGVLWRYDSDNMSSNSYISAKTEGFYHTAFQSFYNNPNYKALKLYDGAPSNIDSNIRVRDSNGVYYLISGSSFASSSNTFGNYEKFSFDTNGTSGSNMLLIDKAGQVLIDDARSSGATAKTFNTAQNPMYGVKVKHVYGEQFVSDENNQLYYFKGSSYSYDVSIVGASPSDVLRDRPNMKKILSPEIKVYSTTKTVAEALALDNDGKVWYATPTEIVCLNDTTENSIGRKQKQDPNFKIVDIYYGYNSTYKAPSYYYYFALDNYGKLWAWGNNAGRAIPGGSNTYITDPICINDVQGVDMANVQSFEIIPLTGSAVVYKATGLEGNVWIWGYNGTGILGNGTTTNVTMPYHINPNISNKKVVDIQFNRSYHAALLCSDGSIYVSGTAGYNTDTNVVVKYKEWHYIASVEGAKKVVPLTINSSTVCGTFMVFVDKVNEETNTTTEEIWTFGFNSKDTTESYCGLDDLESKYISVPQKVMDNNIDIVGFTSKYLDVRVLDGTGKAYGWIKDSETGKYTFQYVTDLLPKITEIYGNTYDLNEIVKMINATEGSSTTKYFAINGKIFSIYFTQGLMDNIYNFGATVSEGTTFAEYATNKALDVDGNLYVKGQYTGLSTLSSWVCTTTTKNKVEGTINFNNGVLSDAVENPMYGIKFKQLINDRFAIDVNNNVWYFPISGAAINISESELSNIATIDAVVGEYEVRNTEGTIYRLVPSGTTSYTRQEVSEATPFSTDTPVSPISIDEVTFVKQTQHKALDDKGNLYVWDRFAGVADYNYSEGILNLTGTEYTSDAVYSTVNGWTVITKAK